MRLCIRILKDAWAAASNKFPINLQKGVAMLEYAILSGLISFFGMSFFSAIDDQVKSAYLIS